MESKLPDLNNYWKKYHDKGDGCLNQKDYAGVINSFECMNALMPLDYRINVSDFLFKEATKETRMLTCLNCKVLQDDEITPYYDISVPLMDLILSGSKMKKVWTCNSCGENNDVSKSKLLIDARKDPDYFQIIPTHPKLVHGLAGRTKLHEEMTIWWHRAKVEIDHHLAKLRRDYKPSDEDEGEDGGEDGGEESTQGGNQ